MVVDYYVDLSRLDLLNVLHLGAKKFLEHLLYVSPIKVEITGMRKMEVQTFLVCCSHASSSTSLIICGNLLMDWPWTDLSSTSIPRDLIR